MQYRSPRKFSARGIRICRRAHVIVSDRRDPAVPRPTYIEWAREYSMSDATNAKVAECLDMAIQARVNARSALSPGDRGFWRIMEERWIHLAQTYRETERLTHSLL
jgi:hypothetical protein